MSPTSTQRKTEVPESFLNERRPPLSEALALVTAGNDSMTIEEATEVLVGKDYFAPRPRPWKLGASDRGMGRQDYAVLDRFGDVVCTVERYNDAKLIIGSVNQDTSE